MIGSEKRILRFTLYCKLMGNCCGSAAVKSAADPQQNPQSVNVASGILDLSFNLLKRIEGFDSLSQLRRLYLVNNKISRIENLGSMTQLRLLELGSNRIREIENLDMLRDLDSLFLGKNKITKLQNMETLSNLTVLSVQSNRLLKIEGLQSLVNLRELYLSDNGIQVLEGLENNDGNQGKYRVTKRGPALSYPMFTLVTGIVGRWRAVCVTALQRPNSDATAIRIVVGIAAASLNVKGP
ncbi:unnamed protein product [Ranitomeya imitator]|uniref:Protein phosphatase 1 regulatory subunit 7 n=1 Tax=Ranitomeya imitator TaxID=111125 RepID=A0ABN9LAH4_9NEOB|nr:unnamed protein product [Ranitomeya imitator]